MRASLFVGQESQVLATVVQRIAGHARSFIGSFATLKPYEVMARNWLGFIYLFGAVDGALLLFFDIHYRHPPEGSFVWGLENTAYFWWFMKLCELVSALSLLMNYKPALGLAISAPISAVLCLIFAFDLNWPENVIMVVVPNLILLKAYSKSFLPLLDNYR